MAMQVRTSYCNRCGYIIKGAYSRCIRCSGKDIQVYEGSFDPELMAKIREAKGIREGSHPLVALLTVGAVAGLVAFAAISIQNDRHLFQIKAIEHNLVALLHR